jgi:hypothetical protein
MFLMAARVLFLLFVALAAVDARAQVGVRVVVLEKGYMRWSPTVVGVEVVNVSGEPLLLRSFENKSWLRFLVRRGNLSAPGTLVRQVQTFEQPDLALEPGERARFRFDLTPFYSIRELGSYVVQAVVRIPGVESEVDLVSEPVEISVVPGRVIWSADYGGGGIPRRKMSLLRHVSGAEERLFAQIEAPDEGLVYLCRPLGRLTLGMAPQAAVDTLGNWSILFRSGPRQFDYFEFTSVGELLQYERLVQVAEPPRLVGGPEGYMVQGGARPEEVREETLRDTQPQFGGRTEAGADAGMAARLPQPADQKPAQARERRPQRESGDSSGPSVKRHRS